MELRVRRIALKDTYTIGKLELLKDGQWVYLCDTIEDKVRDLDRDGKFENGEKKVPGETAIPYGKYNITMNVVSPKFSNYNKYPYARKYHGYMPRLLNVNSFDGILIHPGCSAYSSAGCIIVGKNKIVGKVVDSQQVWCSLMETYLWPARKANESITIEII
jgi:hypothetical protein